MKNKKCKKYLHLQRGFAILMKENDAKRIFTWKKERIF